MVRQLTAIMFTDMVGYTALMQENEHQARLNRDRHRAVLEKAIASHEGRILQFYGDGTLSVFQSAIEAVRCAITIQRKLQEQPCIPLRIGIHTGDVVHDEEGVFGDGVNVASRVQGLSVPGGVLISGKVFDEVKNQPDIDTRHLGAFNLKNVTRPTDVFVIVNDGLTVPDESQIAARRATGARSIAVLPFVNMSSDPENEYFSDGITEEIINALTRVNGLQVTARTSSFAFKNRNEDIRGIAEQLGVSHILEGSVRKVGNRVRITAQLVCASDGIHLFSDVYDRSLDDVFETQEELARTLVDALSDRLTADAALPVHSTAPLVRAHSHDTEAYTEYLKGRFHWGTWTPEGARTAIRYFERSRTMDPTCALPYTGLASAYVYLGAQGYMPGAQAYPLAEETALKALDLEEGVGESHTALATVKLFYDWDWNGAYYCYQKALSLTPGSADVHHLYSLYLRSVGDHAEAVEEMRTAATLDPLSLRRMQSLGEALMVAGDLNEARAQLEHSLVSDPGYRASWETLAWVHVREGRLARAREILDAPPIRAGGLYAAAPLRGYVYALLGRSDDAQRTLDLLHERAHLQPDVNPALDFAQVYAALGDFDRAFEHLERARESRLGALVFLHTNPAWEPLYSDDRYYDLMERVGVPYAVAV